MGRFPRTGAAGLKPSIKESANDWILQLHGISIFGCFAKFGWMNLYAVVLVDGKEVHRTAKGGWWQCRKSTRWDSWTNAISDPGAGVTIMVRSWNPLGKDFLCGVATIPLSEAMCGIRQEHFKLRKYTERTDSVQISGSMQISLLQRFLAKATGQEDVSHKRKHGKQVVPFDSLVPSSEQQRSSREDGNELDLACTVKETMPLTTPRAETADPSNKHSSKNPKSEDA
eukprot:TRINITY_DN23873_c1_g1_i3.p1 TRINITY_DN23873_c1_g1~~TRINITY_DN23873_c1_g1_i3.p1  ORF type:complete len:227 (+),score=25.28 TRINITY_DN23873_c1_g1_i3:73-753(+)